MDCIYNTGGLCYKDSNNVKECPYVYDQSICEDAEED